MMPEGGFGPPPQEPYVDSYVDSLQSLINSAASWSFSRASWLLPTGTAAQTQLAEQGLVDSRKNSYFSVSTTDSDDKMLNHPHLLHPEEQKVPPPVWRSLVRLAGTPTPQYATWESALDELDTVLDAVRQGTAPIVETTMVVHAIFLAAGLPAGCTTNVEPLRHLHLAARDAGILMHVTALRNRPLDSVSAKFGELVHRFVEVSRKQDPIPRFQTEFLVDRHNGTTSVVSELGEIMREIPELKTAVVEIPCCRDLEHLSELLKKASTLSVVCNILDNTGICAFYHACAAPGNDPSGCDVLADFLECRINTHLAIVDDLPGPSDALESLQKLARCPVDVNSSTKITPARTQALFSRTGGLRAGTKSALVEQITRHDQRPEIVHPFLMTFSAFMTELELLEMLEQRYDIEPRGTLEGDNLKDWLLAVRAPIRARVISVVRTWISQYWLLVADEENNIQRQTLLKNLRSFAKRTNNQPLIKVVDRLPIKNEMDDLPEIEHCNTITEAFELPECSANEFAINMTVIKFNNYAKVTPQCLLWRQIGRNTDDHTTPLGVYIEYWNQESNWVSHEILKLHEAEDRARKIEYFIDVCQELRKLNNFSSLMAILSAFSSAGIFRLKSTWARISPQKEQLLNTLKTLMDSSCNFNNYREELWMMHDPCIPFIGLSLMDLQYTYDGNEDFLNGNIHLINFAKWSVIAGIIDLATRFRRQRIHLEENTAITDYLRNAVPLAPPLSDQYDDSLAVEPKVNSRSKSRRSVN